MIGDDSKNSPIAVQGGPISITSANAYPEPAQASVQITFSDNAVLTATYWRLIKNGKAWLSSFDHAQQYGLPAPINAILELQKELESGILTDLRLDRETGDLMLRFAGERTLQVFNFTSYEIWNIQFPNGTVEYSNYVLG
jgi:hypothetical protein